MPNIDDENMVEELKKDERQPFLWNIKRFKPTINLKSLPSKMSYLFLYGIQSSYLPFVMLFLLSIGLSPTQSGIIVGFRSIIALLTTPLWGFLVDKTNRKKTIFVILLSGTALLTFAMPFIANTFNKKIIYFQDSNRQRKTLFYVMLTLALSAASFEIPLYGYIDAEVTSVDNNDISNFGEQRLFGSIGFALFNLLSGFIIDQTANHTGMFYVFLSACLCLLPMAIILFQQNDTPNASITRKGSTLKITIKTCLKLNNFIFLISVLLIGVFQGCRQSFIPTYIVHDLNGGNTIVSLMFTVASFAEIFMFLYASKVISYFNNNLTPIALSIFCYFIKFTLLAFVKNAYLAIPIELLHSICYALFWVAVTAQTKKISSDGIYTTMFSIVNILHNGFGGFFGNLIAGLIYEKYGGKVLLLTFGLVAILYSILLTVYICVKYNNHKAPVKQPMENV